MAPNEFKVYMTLEPVSGRIRKFGKDTAMAKWRWKVKKVEILINNYEIGFGSGLLHPIHNHLLADFCNQQMKHELDVSYK